MWGLWKLLASQDQTEAKVKRLVEGEKKQESEEEGRLDS